MRLKNLFLISLGTLAILAACNLKPLTIDPCAILPDLKTCHAVPLNNPSKPEYDRLISASDICVTDDEYAALQKAYRTLLRRCGNSCK